MRYGMPYNSRCRNSREDVQPLQKILHSSARIARLPMISSELLAGKQPDKITTVFTKQRIHSKSRTFLLDSLSGAAFLAFQTGV